VNVSQREGYATSVAFVSVATTILENNLKYSKPNKSQIIEILVIL
jgi:hypothetical protein